MMKPVLFLTLGVLLGVSAAWLGFRAGDDDPGASGFLERRVAVLERENARMAGMLEEARGERDRENNRLERERIMEAVESLRGLEFIEAVDFQVLGRADLPSLIESKIDEQYTPGELADLSLLYSGVGLLPEGFDLKAAYVRLFTEQVAAFYDQHGDTLHMFEGKNLDDAVNRMILAHELVHSLQDQHFRLESLPLELKTNDDRMFAATALVEGDATLAMSLFLAGDITADNLLGSIASSLFAQSMGELAESPPFLREGLLFPYLKGQEFAASLYARGGMEAIDAAFGAVPVSTRQILHPHEYIENPDFEPRVVAWDAPPEGYELVGVNVLGEFGWRVLLSQWIGRERAEAAASGWIGDGYRVLRAEDGLRLDVRGWWENEAEAAELMRALVEGTAIRRGVPVPAESEGDTVVIEHPRGRAVVSRAGTRVSLVDSWVGE